MADNIVHTSSNDVNDKPLPALDPLPTPRDKDEPPSQWAASTIDALAPGPPGLHSADKPPGGMAAVTSTYNTPAYPPSTATTPGNEFPGAFPRGHGQSQSGVTTQDVRDAAASAMETAKGYAISAKDTVGGYLPSSVAAYLPQSLTTDKSAAPNPNGEREADVLERTPSTGRQPSDNSLARPQPESETMRDSDSIVDNKSGTTSGTPSSQQQDNVEEPSTDASTRSLAGSRVDTWSRTATPGANSMLGDASINDSADSNTRNGDGTLKTPASAIVEAQADHSAQHLDDNSNSGETNLERPDIQHHAEETRHIPSDASPPDPVPTPNAKSPSSIHPDSPNTAGREYPFSSGEEKELREGGRPDTMRGFVHGSVDSTKATPGHEPVGTQENKGNLSSLVDSAKATAGHGSSVDSTKATPGHGPMGGPQDKGRGEADIGMLPSTRGVNAALNTKTEATPTSSGSATATPKDADHKPKTAGDDAPLGIGPTPPSHAKSDSDSANSKEKPKTKSGFMDKIRGEMKVLSGKLEHDQEKVDEGRRMMGKPTTGNKN
ncbi:hypothetical protein GALMADRAFT_245041 [Galerina marginata CBS 339.88]|uniref:Uncharacterized protein n=1 Tax=Galerina marginata (strain CBS 339.88) TaxID=685588 RepID=A0A067T6U9_GALM3|nr:hypothetical protein GALMADRAFT_245041 [Galerina marginata CBS 339.88]